MSTGVLDAATLVLLRDPELGAGAPEVLLVRRGKKVGFGPGAHVFPGGVLERKDYEPDTAALSPRLTPAAAAALMPDVQPAEKALGFFVAAIRETFEEAGVLLARRADGSIFVPTPSESAILAKARHLLHTGELDFVQWMTGQGLTLATDILAYFAHWITPQARSQRFAARFFLAPAPPGLQVSADGVEVFDHCWISPADAVAKDAAGEMILMNPTARNLEKMADFSSKEELMEFMGAGEIKAIMPKLLILPDGRERPVNPWEPEYDKM